MEVADLLLMQQKLRSCLSAMEIAHLVVNESNHLINFDSALILDGSLRGRLKAVSGLPEPVQNTPFSDWVTNLAKELRSHRPQTPVVIRPADVSSEVSVPWTEYLPEHVLFCPLGTSDSLLLARKQAWTDEEVLIADYWAGAISHALWACRPAARDKIRTNIFRARNFFIVTICLLILSLLIPTSQTITTDAEVVPLNPSIIRSPMDGVVEAVAVESNQFVYEDDPVITLDDRNIKTRLTVTKQELEIAKAELRRANQSAVTDHRAAANLPILRSRIAQQSTELQYVQTLLEQTTLIAPTAGIAILNDPLSLKGKPVQLGEQLMTIASLDSVELEFWVSLEDSINIPAGSTVTLYPNVRPDQLYTGKVRYINYQAEVSPTGLLGFRGRAALTEGELSPRLGWRGTAKVEGEQVKLLYFILRRPIAAARQWFGL